ncbi:MAG: phenylalanine--tRNA ligase beta subunit-related protein [Methanocellales archaeon]|nr:phenylalanine--tRNA ligase beta subunit-related protein [Methanocellales archaeon]MDD3291912.1 phenylalanine--tRNA ligase beta subunit-related protein [Methanocellales archaeon]MDD5235777.1 phenylalanine--tRNA ligase beta subunit-related protein [Methanocellales archaeon]MDD5485534.1 phenylalanine--tRNA ligase beta subunit-related protein [Methanocellales archaeon]
MNFYFDPKVKERFPGLKVCIGSISDMHPAKEDMEGLRESVFAKVRERYSLEDLKDVSIFRAYRDFFWNIGVDPTKVRPAGEALIRRVLRGSPIPKINPIVDAYNLSSIETGIALAAFDESLIKGGNLTMRFAEPGELFKGIGMDEPMRLRGKEVVLSYADEDSEDEKLVAIYPYRDADSTKVTSDTKNVILLSCGVPGIEDDLLEQAIVKAIDYITRFCGGTSEYKLRA